MHDEYCEAKHSRLQGQINAGDAHAFYNTVSKLAESTVLLQPAVQA
jgi:hypothetical protein